MQTIYDILLSNATLLELYRSKGLTDTQISLQNALGLINKRIEKTQGKWTTQKLNAIKKLIQDEITKSYGGLYESIQDESTAIAQITYNSIVGASMSASIPVALINDLTKSNRLIQGYEFKELFKLTQDNHARQLRVSLASAIGAGMTPTEITRELNKKNESLTRGQLATNVRTVIFDSANEASYKSYAKLEKDGFIDYYEYVAVLDSRTSEVCRNSDGRKFYMPIDEIPKGEIPSRHFNCRSKLVPANKYSRQDGTRASQFGSVPANENYSTWFSKQPASYQKSVLGNTKYNAYKSGVYKIQSLPDVVGKNIDLDKLREHMDSYVNS